MILWNLPKLSRMRRKILIIIAAFFLIIFGRILIDVVKLSPAFFQYLFSRDIILKKSDENINLLLLGIAGGTHQGPNLTDTIIFASINPVENKVTLVSLPRDLWLPDLSAKINTAYAVGESKRKGGGLILAKAVVAKILGQPIDYGLRIDFNGFVKAVDLVGGIEVDVERTLDDYEYPIAGKEDDPCGHTEEELITLATASSQLEAFPCRYRHIRFDKGRQSLNGEKALEFVRSRHGKGEEGTDFARSKRQEKVLLGLRDKVFSIQTILNPGKILGLYGILKDNLDTDIREEEFDDFARLAQKLKSAKITNAVLDYGDEKAARAGLLLNPPMSGDYENQWVLIPRVGNDNFSEIQKYVECEIKQDKCSISDKPSL